MEHENGAGIGKKIFKIFLKLIIVVIFLLGAAFALRVAPNYVRNDITDKINLVVNYSNVTGRMKHDLIVDDNGVVYLSFDDIMNYYDDNIYYDEQYNQIVTSTETKLAILKLDKNKITINGRTSEIKGSAIIKNDSYYLPISEMEDVYDIKVTKSENKVIMESLDRKLTTANAKKNFAVKFKATPFSRTLEKVEANQKLVIAEVEPIHYQKVGLEYVHKQEP